MNPGFLTRRSSYFLSTRQVGVVTTRLPWLRVYVHRFQRSEVVVANSSIFDVSHTRVSYLAIGTFITRRRARRDIWRIVSPAAPQNPQVPA